MIYLAEIIACTSGAGALTTLYVTTARFFATGPSDTPSNTIYLPRLKTAGLLRRDITSPGRISGATTQGFGYIELANPDGALDAWMNYSFDGRSCIIKAGDEGDSYSSFEVVQEGTMEQPEADLSTIRIRIRDRLGELAKSHLTTAYAGTNSLPSGLEGVDDLQGAIKPRLYGRVRNISPLCVNTSRLIYQITDGPYNTATIFDQGVTLTNGANYSSISDMETTAPSAGQARLCVTDGYFRLGSTPAGQITCNAQKSSTAANRYPGYLFQQIAENSGIATGDISSSDISTLDAACPYECGIWIQDSTESIEILNKLSESVGAWYGFDRNGTLRVQQLLSPGTAAFTLQPYEITQITKKAAQDGGAGIPAWRLALKYRPNYTIQLDSDLAGSVTLDYRNYLRRNWLGVVSSDTAVKTKYLMATNEKIITLMHWGTDAATEAARRFALIKVERSMYIVRVRITRAILQTADLGISCAVNISRWSMNTKTFRIVGIMHDPIRQAMELTLWG